MNRLRRLWINLRSSFWFVPSLMIAGSAVIAVALIEVDSAQSDQWLAEWPRVFGVGTEGARQILATIAGSMMTVMGITFSMTLLALTLASSQYTSRILRNFMRNRITQVTLGTFAGIFVYCLIVLRTIRGGEAEFVPTLGVFFAFVLAIGGVGVLIYFLHHIASSIQALNIIASIANETIAAIERVFPREQGRKPDETKGQDEVFRPPDQRTWYAVPAAASGYIQTLDDDALLRVARDQKTTLRMERGMGAFVVQNTALASLALTSPPDRETIAALNRAYGMSRQRTIEQDPAFGIRQIVDMALKALSPGINDTSTAVVCVDYLSLILARLAVRPFPPERRYDEGVLRVIAMVPTFEALLGEAFDQIRSSAAGNAAILARMLDGIHAVASLTRSLTRRRALDQQVQWIAELADRTLESTHDRVQTETRLRQVREALEAGPAR